jgi:benzoate/toluate 1,2-dioxygenase reductase component
MAFQVALSFEDGITRFIDCDEDEKVADAAYRGRINIPMDCRDGACGTCKSYCESGTYEGGDYIDEALTEEEAAAGYCLPCQMTPNSDLILRIATTSDTAKTAASKFRSTMTHIERYSATTVGFTIEVDDRAKLAFLAGQYVNIGVPGTEATRSYSFSTGPSSAQLSFLVRIIDGGLMSGYLSDRAAVGDTLEFSGPLGSFFLREPVRPVLLLAGGTGLAPVLSILERIREKNVEQPVHLIYGVTADEDLVELDTITNYTKALPSFDFQYCVADPTSTADNRGYVTSLLSPVNLHDGEVDIYVCGPPPMVEAVRGHLAAEGTLPLNFYFEKFNTSATPVGVSA